MVTSSPKSVLDPLPNDMVGDPSHILPSEDVRLCNEQMIRMARALVLGVAKSDSDSWTRS